MKIASSSGSPTERSSCCWVPSPQSNSSRSPPARSSMRGQAAPRGRHGARRAGEEEREVHGRLILGGLSRARPARTSGARPATVAIPIVWRGARRRSVGEPGLKIAKPVALLVQREVRVAEDDGVGVREAPAHPRQPAGGGPGVVDHRDPRARRPRRSAPAAAAPAARPRRRCRGPRAPAARAPRARSSTESSIRSPACRIASAAREPLDAGGGERAAPRGRCVSETMPIRMS